MDNDNDQTPETVNAAQQVFYDAVQLIKDGTEVSWKWIRDKLIDAGRKDKVWAGIPLPVLELEMVLEEKYPYQGLSQKFYESQDAEAIDRANDALSRRFEQRGIVEPVHNSWYDPERQHWVCLYRARGKTRVFLQARWDNCATFNTLKVAANECWSIEAEERAMTNLRSIIGEHCYKMYLTTGMFLEHSKRSGIHYIFRRLRPTIALGVGLDGMMRGIVALCLHPIGYYRGSWAGCMVPTDDVLSHLLLMRGDEHRFWRLAGQAPLHYPAAGWIGGAA